MQPAKVQNTFNPCPKEIQRAANGVVTCSTMPCILRTSFWTFIVIKNETNNKQEK